MKNIENDDECITHNRNRKRKLKLSKSISKLAWPTDAKTTFFTTIFMEKKETKNEKHCYCSNNTAKSKIAHSVRNNRKAPGLQCVILTRIFFLFVSIRLPIMILVEGQRFTDDDSDNLEARIQQQSNVVYYIFD